MKKRVKTFKVLYYPSAMSGYTNHWVTASSHEAARSLPETVVQVGR